MLGYQAEPQAFFKKLSDLISTNLNVRSPSEEQLKAPIDFVKRLDQN